VLFAFQHVDGEGLNSATCFDYGELPPFWSVREIYDFFTDEENYYYVTSSVYNPPDQSAEYYFLAIWKSPVTNRDSFGRCQAVSLPKQLSPPILPSESTSRLRNEKHASGRHSFIPIFQRKDPNDRTSPIIATKIIYFYAFSSSTKKRRIITRSMDLSTGAVTLIKDLDLNEYFTDINSENTTSLGVTLEHTHYDFSGINGNVFVFSDYEVKFVPALQRNVLKLYDKIITVSQNGNLIEDHETLIREYEGVGETIHMPFITDGTRWINFATMNDPDKHGIEFNQFFSPPSHLSPIQPQTVVWRKF